MAEKSSGRGNGFFKGVWSELKKVHWPNKKQLATFTGVVLVVCAAVALVISAFDWVISSLMNLLLSIA